MTTSENLVYTAKFIYFFMEKSSDKATFFAKNLFKNCNLDDSGISLTAFPSRTNLKLHNVSITPKIDNKSHNKP